MKKPLVKLLIVIGLLTGAMFSTRANATVYGVNWAGEFYAVDESDAGGTLIGPTGLVNLNAMASDASGTLYSYSGTLLTIDPLTGLATAGPQVNPLLDVRGLAFSPDGTLFAVDSGDATEDLDDLYTIDVTTGAATRIGSTGVPGVQALAFDRAGNLYGWESGAGNGIGIGLIAIDPLTGLATDVNPAVDGRAFDVQTLEFAADGTLYGANYELQTVNVTTGELTPIGHGGYGGGLRGIAFVPEPGTLGLLAVAGLFAVAYARGRRRRG